MKPVLWERTERLSLCKHFVQGEEVGLYLARHLNIANECISTCWILALQMLTTVHTLTPGPCDNGCVKMLSIYMIPQHEGTVICLVLYGKKKQNEWPLRKLRESV